MQIRRKLQPHHTLALIVFVVTAWRIYYLFINGRALTVDEAQYWSWSQHLAWGYHSKAPLIAWVIDFFTQIFGQNEPAIRLFSPLGFGIASLAVGATGRLLYDEQVGWWSGLTFLSLPSMTLASTIMSTDPLFLTCWALGFYAFVRAWQQHSLGWWAVCGLALGLGLLSKYTTIAFFLSMLIYYFITPARTEQRNGLLLCGAIAMVAMLPNILWNASHGYVAFLHVAQHNAAFKGFHLHPQKLLSFVGAQFLVFGPVLFASLLVMLRQWRRVLAEDAGERLLFAFSLPLLVIMLFEAELSRAYAHWAAPSYIAGSIAVSAYLLRIRQVRWLKISLGLHIAVALLFYGIELAGDSAPTAPALKHLHAYRAAAPEWRGGAQQIAKRFAQQPTGTVFLTDDRVVLMKSFFYGGVPYAVLRTWNPLALQERRYDTKTDLQLGDNALFVSDGRNPPQRVTQRFAQCSEQPAISIAGRRLPIYACQQFLGYE